MASIIKSDNGVSSGITGIVQSADSSGQLVLQTTTSGGTATTAVTIDNTQKVTFANSIGFGSNAGITFNNSSALTNSTLNDYETGTWTPTLSRTGANPSLTYTATGSYTKVGRLVTINAAISISAVSSQGTGGAIIQGSPFTPALSYNGIGAVYFNSAFSTDVITSASISTDPWIVLHAAVNSGSNITGTYAVGTLYFSITYTTTF